MHDMDYLESFNQAKYGQIFEKHNLEILKYRLHFDQAFKIHPAFLSTIENMSCILMNDWNTVLAFW